jgi:hypothetical protein
MYYAFNLAIPPQSQVTFFGMLWSVQEPVISLRKQMLVT